jgi:hypothetical protein
LALGLERRWRSRRERPRPGLAGASGLRGWNGRRVERRALGESKSGCYQVTTRRRKGTPTICRLSRRRRAQGATLDELARSYNVGISTIRRATCAAIGHNHIDFRNPEYDTTNHHRQSRGVDEWLPFYPVVPPSIAVPNREKQIYLPCSTTFHWGISPRRTRLIPLSQVARYVV